jgi:hypothetical protein
MQHLVTAQALDEDGGEADELAVVWELEPGAQIHERATLPDPARGFDRPGYVDAFLDAVRWGAVASADVGVLHAPSAAASPSRTTSSTPSRGPCRCRASTCSSPTTSASARPSRLASSSRSSSCATARAPSSSSARRASSCSGATRCATSSASSFASSTASSCATCAAAAAPRQPLDHFPRLITSIDFLKRERPLRLFRDLLPRPRTAPTRAASTS